MQHFIWNIDRVLVTFGHFRIYWYGFLFVSGILSGFGLMRWFFSREGKPVRDVESLLLFIIVGTIVGARLGQVLFYDPARYLQHPLEILEIWRGGLASHGGIAGIIVALYLYARQHRDQPYLWLLDRIFIASTLGGIFIRIGNFFNSEIVGTPSDLPWAVIFSRIDSVPRHPTQLYEALAYAVIFVILMLTYKRGYPKLRTGVLSGLALVLVFTARFLLEFVKVRQAAYEQATSLNVGQWLSLPFIALGLILMIYALRRKDKTTTAG
jgi:phosphatidylglycerol:prolipoprotein diacylglycerol transferase